MPQLYLAPFHFQVCCFQLAKNVIFNANLFSSSKIVDLFHFRFEVRYQSRCIYLLRMSATKDKHVLTVSAHCQLSVLTVKIMDDKPPSKIIASNEVM